MPGHRELNVSGDGHYDIGSYVNVSDMDFILVAPGGAHVWPTAYPQRLQHAGWYGLAVSGDGVFAHAAVLWWDFITFPVTDNYGPNGIPQPCNHFFWHLEPGTRADIGASWA